MKKKKEYDWKTTKQKKMGVKAKPYLARKPHVSIFIERQKHSWQ